MNNYTRCHYCSERNPDDAVWCAYCGSRLRYRREDDSLNAEEKYRREREYERDRNRNREYEWRRMPDYERERPVDYYDQAPRQKSGNIGVFIVGLTAVLVLFFLIVFFIFAINPVPCESEKIATGTEQVAPSAGTVVHPTRTVEEKENFADFKKKFSADSLFQMSRIVFPLTVKWIPNNTDPSVEYFTEKDEFKRVNFLYASDGSKWVTEKYTEGYVVTNLCTCGTHDKYFFELENGLWFLKKRVIDSSRSHR
jgi:hypothetical protein